MFQLISWHFRALRSTSWHVQLLLVVAPRYQGHRVQQMERFWPRLAGSEGGGTVWHCECGDYGDLWAL